MKRIFFKENLVSMLRGPDPPRCTYRTHRLKGVYKVVAGDWFHARDTGVVIDVTTCVEVDASTLTLGDADLCGLGLTALRQSFKKWYQTETPKPLFRNWLKVLEPAGADRDPPRGCYPLVLAAGGGVL